MSNKKLKEKDIRKKIKNMKNGWINIVKKLQIILEKL